jgi:hypothetical protein
MVRLLKLNFRQALLGFALPNPALTERYGRKPTPLAVRLIFIAGRSAT